MSKKIKSYWTKIYLSGDINIIKQLCREYCMEIGLCVTITPTTFIYTGGEEFGVEIGLINYPRFPDSEDKILEKSIKLAEKCRKGSFQHSFLILTPTETFWHSNKENEK